ncbi:MAG: MoaD/ThiS family protein [Kiloniellales bacterium]
MKITIKTAGLLGRYLPPGSAGDTAELEVEPGATALDVMKQLRLPLEGSYLVVLNGTALPKRERARRPLSENDVLAIMPPLRGG